jgi:hypothetical protein
VTAEELLAETASDSYGRLRWQVLRRLGICPASLRALLLPRRAVLRFAGQLVLDDGGAVPSEVNPNYDPARFQRLAEGERI